MQDHPSNTAKRSNTLPKSAILRGRESFSRVFKNGKRISGSVVDTRFLIVDDGFKTLKAGFAAGRKSGPANRRNRCKRLMREAYRQNRHELQQRISSRNDTSSLELVFTAKSGSISFRQAERDIITHLDRLSGLL